tara:strand:- start:2924 stop:3322 length:399 start_codon:yes stop_codon:yes gene_type:complete
MNQQLKLVLHKYYLELTSDEQEEISDLIILYCEFNQSWMDEDYGEVEGIQEHKLADQILDLVRQNSKTKTITFNRDQIACINHALDEKEELWGSGYDIEGDETGEELEIVDKEGHLIGVLKDIDKKIKEVLK